MNGYFRGRDQFVRRIRHCPRVLYLYYRRSCVGTVNRCKIEAQVVVVHLKSRDGPIRRTLRNRQKRERVC